MLNDFCVNLRLFRQVYQNPHDGSLGMSQEELASRIGVSEKQVSRWENGVVFPNLTTFVSICEKLKKTPNEMLGCKDEYLEKSGLSIDSINALINDHELSEALNFLLSSWNGRQIIGAVYKLCKNL